MDLPMGLVNYLLSDTFSHITGQPPLREMRVVLVQICDPRVPLQRSKLENHENDIFGVKKCPSCGPSWTHLNGLFGAFNSLP